jgi:O-acetylserine/cysteine efflux transporter
MVGDGAQRAQAAEVDHEVDCTSHIQKVHSFFPVRGATLMRMPRKHVLLAIAVAAVWGVNFVVIHVGLEHFPPLLFAALRFVLVALAVPFVPKPQVPVRYVVAVGLFMSAGQFGLLFLGIDKGVPAGLASLVLQLQVIFTVVLAVIFLGERPRPAQIAGGMVAFAGIGVIAAGRASAVPLGALGLTVGAALSWGIGNVAGRKAASPNPLGMLVWSSLVPPIPLLAASLITEHGIGHAFTTLDAGSLGALLFVVVVSTFGGFGAWTMLLSRYPTSQVVPFALLVPVAGIGSPWLLLSETPTAAELIGAAIVLGGLGLTVRPPRAMRQPAGGAAAWREATSRPTG